MSMLKEERKELRDEIERTYGIHLREDDELLPIIQFITEASKLADLNTSESKRLLEEMKSASEKMIADQTVEFKNLLTRSSQMLSTSASESKEMINATKKGLDGLPKMVKDFKDAIQALKIPEQVTVKRISFDSGTMSFLWKYFIMSLGVIVLTLSASVWWAYNVNKQMAYVRTKYQPQRHEWLLRYYDHMKKEAPNVTQKFIDENPMPAVQSEIDLNN
jgi:flagellar hook-basal body complex protein FliE